MRNGNLRALVNIYIIRFHDIRDLFGDGDYNYIEADQTRLQRYMESRRVFSRFYEGFYNEWKDNRHD